MDTMAMHAYGVQLMMKAMIVFTAVFAVAYSRLRSFTTRWRFSFHSACSARLLLWTR